MCGTHWKWKVSIQCCSSVFLPSRTIPGVMLCIQYIPKTWVFIILLGVGTVHKDIAGCVLIFFLKRR